MIKRTQIFFIIWLEICILTKIIPKNMNNFIEIGNILVNKDLLNSKFTCNLLKCKGACCTMEGEYGAPLRKSEINIIENFLPIVKKYLSKEHIKIIDESGFWEEKDEELMISSLNNKDCVFAYNEGGIAKCAIEKSYFANEIDFRKPISCHLFPIRINHFGGEILKYEKYNECESALIEGEKTDLSVAEFCKDSLIREYEENWYHELEKFIED